MLYTICFIVIWSVTLTGAYQALYSSLEEPDPTLDYEIIVMPNGRTVKALRNEDGIVELNLADTISFIASLSTGFVLALVRIMEPYFWYLIKKTFLSLFGIAID